MNATTPTTYACFIALRFHKLLDIKVGFDTNFPKRSHSCNNIAQGKPMQTIPTLKLKPHESMFFCWQMWCDVLCCNLINMLCSILTLGSASIEKCISCFFKFSNVRKVFLMLWMLQLHWRIKDLTQVDSVMFDYWIFSKNILKSIDQFFFCQWFESSTSKELFWSLQKVGE